jgi:hypothetical protein
VWYAPRDSAPPVRAAAAQRCSKHSSRAGEAALASNSVARRRPCVVLASSEAATRVTMCAQNLVGTRERAAAVRQAWKGAHV